MSWDLKEIPRLRRSLELFPMEVKGVEVPCLRDVMGVSKFIVSVPPLEMFVLRFVDGERSFTDILDDFMLKTNQVLPTEFLDNLLTTLDNALMLDSRHFREEMRRLEDAYHAAPLREPKHVGGDGYPPEPEALARALEGHFTSAEGPGDALRREPASRRLHAVVAPHIDYARGGASYAWTYAEIARDPADLYVVLGTSHAPLSQHFSVTRKSFGTPFGPLATDVAFLDLLEEETGMRLETDPLVHRTEHSIELQAVWMRHLLPERTRIAPILCGSFGAMIDGGVSPMENHEVRRFIEGLRRAIDRCGKRVVLVAAADLAHVGKGFGDAQAPDEEMLDAVEQADIEMMEAAVRRDPDGFFASVQRDGDRRRICGLSPIYAMLAAMKPSEGRLLNYKQCVDPFRTVTIASAAWFE